MAKVLVYNNDNNRMETYYRGENEAMPYNTRKNTYSWRIQTALVKALHFGLVNVLCRLGTAKDTSLVNLFQQVSHLKGLGKVAILAKANTMQELHLMYANFVLVLKEQPLEIVQKIQAFGHTQNLLRLHQLGFILIKDLFQVPVQVGGYPLVKRRSVGMYTLIAQDDLNT